MKNILFYKNRTTPILVSLLILVGLFTRTSVFAQDTNVRSISGVVTAQLNGEPLIGVNVTVENSQIGTVTDIDGNFNLSVKNGQKVIFSYIGFKTKEVLVTAKTKDINVGLIEDTEMLDELVVIGYGIQKKKLNTGATAQIKGDDISKLNTTSPLQALQGQTPGVNITSTSGQPGDGVKVTIRGLGTVGNASPLYLIDGIAGDISTLNPSDIESIDVLKDAASAAIYGAQAANGVVLITTKSGKEGKAQVTFDAYFGVQNVARKAKLLNANQYQTIMDEAALNSNAAPFDWSSFESIYNPDGSLIDTDWADTMFKKNAKVQNYSLGVNGGSETSNYAISLAYLSQEGIMGGKEVSNYDRYNFRVNSEHKLYGGFLKVGEHISFVHKDEVGVAVGNQFNNSLRGAFGTSPLSPVYSDNGFVNKEGVKSPFNDTSHSDWYNGDSNPYGKMMTNTNNKSSSQNLSADLYAEMEPIKNLKIRSVFGINYNNYDYRGYTPEFQFSVFEYNTSYTSVSQNIGKNHTLTWTNTASYNWDYKDHSFNALLGMESTRFDGLYVGAGNRYLKSMFNDWSHAYIDNTEGTEGEGKHVSGRPEDQVRTVSYFGRFGWDFKEKYMLNATLRADGSSKFSSGNRFGYFPSVSAGWVMTNESFMEKSRDWLDFLKLRLSWGQVGNQNIDNFQYLAPIKTSDSNYVFGGTSGNQILFAPGGDGNVWGAYPNRLANNNLKWETSEQINIGIDSRFLDGRLALNLDYYTKKTKNWLVKAPILATAGAEAPFINGGNVKNSGIEVALSWNDNIGDFNYNIGVNGAYNKNKVGSIPTDDGIIHGQVNTLYPNSDEFYRAENGHAIGYFWGYKTAGIFQNDTQIEEWIAAGNGVLQSNPKPGDVIYVDTNGDGKIDSSDRTDLGNGIPKVTFGLNLGFSYKNFDFSMVASGVAGNKIVQSYRDHTNPKANYSAAVLNRWTGEGTSNRMPRMTNTNINWQFSDLYIQKGDFLRISNITLGYDFAPLINVKFLSQLRVYAQIQNAFTFTKYDGMDPEIGYGMDGWVSGIDLGYYPRPRTVLFGVNVKF